MIGGNPFTLLAGMFAYIVNSLPRLSFLDPVAADARITKGMREQCGAVAAPAPLATVGAVSSPVATPEKTASSPPPENVCARFAFDFLRSAGPDAFVPPSVPEEGVVEGGARVVYVIVWTWICFVFCALILSTRC